MKHYSSMIAILLILSLSSFSPATKTTMEDKKAKGAQGLIVGLNDNLI
ncbi:MAG: hypothetical protein JWQ25_1286, partial [Daejeonella sp.]|nr:hypothetical protein [Daejeonella sp.]